MARQATARATAIGLLFRGRHCPLALRAGCLLLAMTSGWSQASEQTANPSRYQRTVESLQQAPPELSATFAEVALAELVAIYLAEAGLARNQARESARSGKLLGWAVAVENYAEDLLILLEAVEQGAPATLQPNRNEVPTLTVAERAIMLSHPRAGQQGEFEQRILADFCAREDCAPLTAIDPDAAPLPVSAALVTPEWSFNPEGAVCRYRGITLPFRGDQNLTRLRSLCNQLAQELALLANEIAWQRRHGVVVEWHALAVNPVPQTPEHVVILNAAGDSILVSVPLLYATPALLADILPWLQSVQADDSPQPLRLDPAKYGWQAV